MPRLWQRSSSHCQQFRITEIQSHRITGSQKHRIRETQNHRIKKHRITETEKSRITESQDNRNTWSQNHRNSKSQKYRITESKKPRNTRSQNHRSQGHWIVGINQLRLHLLHPERQFLIYKAHIYWKYQKLFFIAAVLVGVILYLKTKQQYILQCKRVIFDCLRLQCKM